MTKTLKRIRLLEISGVDRPAQPLAEALIMKRDDTTIQKLVDNARAVQVQGPTARSFTAAQFEEGMLELAKQEAQRTGTTPEMALVNGWRDPSSDLCLLGKAWSLCQVVEYVPRH